MVQEIIAEDESLFLVKVILKGNAGNQKLLILLDGDEGIGIDECSFVSRKLSEQLEELDLIDGKYMLEVSSAGLDFPLSSERQYRKNIGRSLKVDLKNGETVSGELKDVNSECVTIEVVEKKTTKQLQLAFNDISKSMVLVSFK